MTTPKKSLFPLYLSCHGNTVQPALAAAAVSFYALIEHSDESACMHGEEQIIISHQLKMSSEANLQERCH